jgi:hypothetical protein
MRDIVIVPTYDRPEFLWVCLEQLFKAKGANEKWVWVCEDIHADKPKSFVTEMEMLATIRYFENLTERYLWPKLKYVGRKPHTTYGNSYNLLAAVQEASTADAEKVYIVEDDVLVTKDFFEWNDQVFSNLPPWVACAGRLNRSLNFAMNGPDAMDESIKDVNACKAVIGAYNSWATCFSRQALDEIVSIIPSYDTFRPGFEQDMLIQNHMRRNKLVSVWPFVERAFHFGWTSYHRCGRPITGNLEEKVKFIQTAVRSKSILCEMASLQEMDTFFDPTEAR